MRLIDADALMAQLKAIRIRSNDLTIDYKRGHSDGIITAVEYADDAPTADAVPVVRGEWRCNPDDKKFSLVCSVCGQVMPFVPEYLPDSPPFCNCGAKMESEGST